MALESNALGDKYDRYLFISIGYPMQISETFLTDHYSALYTLELLIDGSFLSPCINQLIVWHKPFEIFFLTVPTTRA